jgi:putative SOS response-associated peptidase YedK
MCGRYTVTSPEGVAEALELALSPPAEPTEWWKPRFNVAPTQPAPVVSNREGPRTIEMMRWGLVPPWAEDLSVGARWINARAETAAASKVFRDAMRRRRCLVLADGFYEWAGASQNKMPFLFHRPGRAAFAMGGIWERWHGPDDVWINSFAILTTRPNALVSPIHDRMPVVIAPADYARWLASDELDADGIEDLLAPWEPGDWKAQPVSTHVNKVTNDDPACLEPPAADES